MSLFLSSYSIRHCQRTQQTQSNAHQHRQHHLHNHHKRRKSGTDIKRRQSAIVIGKIDLIKSVVDIATTSITTQGQLTGRYRHRYHLVGNRLRFVPPEIYIFGLHDAILQAHVNKK